MHIPKDLAIESEWVLKAISHDLRRRILGLLAEGTSQTYTFLLLELGLSTGKLNFHLKQLTGLIEKQDDGSYILTPIGKEAINILNQVYSISENKEQTDYLKSITLGTSLKQIKPAPEIKKKWYFWLSIIVFVIIQFDKYGSSS